MGPLKGTQISQQEFDQIVTRANASMQETAIHIERIDAIVVDQAKRAFSNQQSLKPFINETNVCIKGVVLATVVTAGTVAATAFVLWQRQRI